MASASDGQAERPADDSALRNEIFLQAGLGSVEGVKRLLDDGVSADTCSELGGDKVVSLLMLAAGGGHIDLVKLLLHAGATIDLTSSNGATGLFMAAAAGHLDRSSSWEGKDRGGGGR